MFLDRITVFCFAASYSVALAFELWNLLRPRSMLRLLGLSSAGAGLLAHTLFLAVQRLSLSSRHGALLFLAWLVTLFYSYAVFHHRKVAWGLFALPLILALVVLSGVFAWEPSTPEQSWPLPLLSFGGTSFWSTVHGTLLLLAAVGLCLSFVASTMYLVQARRLWTKDLPGHGLQLLSLERLGEIHQRAIIVVFPLLTAGIIIGMALLAQVPPTLVTGAGLATPPHAGMSGWADPRVITAFVLWLVLAILLCLRYRLRTPGRRVAVLTIIALLLLVVTFALPHTLHGGGGVP